MQNSQPMILARMHGAQIARVAILMAAVTGLKGHAQRPSGPVPVLLELFTSEGCSSCPPADELVEKTDRKQPVEGAELIVLSEHVDYWNHLGWADPYSSRLFTERQQEYAARFGDEDIYTPELVVDGSRSVVGSDWPKAESAIKELLHKYKIPVSVTAERNEGEARIHIAVESNLGRKQAVVYLVLAYDHARSRVARGENAGRDLSHVAVAYSIQEIAKIESESKLNRSLSVLLPRESAAGDRRVIVFVRASDTTEIIGVAQVRL